MKLDGRVALVTGGGSGIGRGICLELAAAGADVAVNYRTNATGAQEVTMMARSLGRRASAVQADVSDVVQIDLLIRTVVEQFGMLDILINNAGIDLHRPFMEVNERVWDQVIGTNLKGTFFCSQRAAREMVKRSWGRIINISSVHGLRTRPTYAHYAASKSGIHGLTRALAVELAPLGITVNTVCPGFVEVDRTSSDPGYDRTIVGRHIPLGRVGTPADVAKQVAFLASDAADFVTGQIIAVDGGSTALLPPERREHYPM
jgi:NAD(P)-dependent dehydrogenase (short-subunit alcohol dehydrogenase family)